MTASPSATSKNEYEMEKETRRLCELIEGKIFMPKIYQDELWKIVNRPELNFIEITVNSRDAEVRQSNL